jgi:hypothetical protein
VDRGPELVFILRHSGVDCGVGKGPDGLARRIGYARLERFKLGAFASFGHDGVYNGVNADVHSGLVVVVTDRSHRVIAPIGHDPSQI